MKKNIFIAGSIIFAILGLIFIFNIANRPKAVVAFVIDDWGYNQRNIDIISETQIPLTIAILPNLRYSDDIAEAVRKNSKMCDIMLHLPLESKSNRAAEIDTIRCNMEKDEVLSILEKDIDSLPGLIGVSNHQGSKATEDEALMRVVLTYLKKRRLFFLDSQTTTNSACPGIARDIGLRYAERDVFLDITDQTDMEHFEFYIRKQIKELADVAVENGRAIGIGHNKKITLEVIKDSILGLEKQGIKIVPLKELIR